MITVKYFGSLKERVGRESEAISLGSITTVQDVWDAVRQGLWPSGLLAAVNQEYAQINDVVSDGDEVAFFPPVTGG